MNLKAGHTFKVWNERVEPEYWSVEYSFFHYSITPSKHLPTNKGGGKK